MFVCRFIESSSGWWVYPTLLLTDCSHSGEQPFPSLIILCQFLVCWVLWLWVGGHLFVRSSVNPKSIVSQVMTPYIKVVSWLNIYIGLLSFFVCFSFLLSWVSSRAPCLGVVDLLFPLGEFFVLALLLAGFVPFVFPRCVRGLCGVSSRCGRS